MIVPRPFTCILPILVAVLHAVSGFSADNGGNTTRGLRQITPELLQKNIDYLASDSLQGRDTPSLGLEAAAAYIAGSFRQSGLLPVNGSYFQPFSICSKSLDDTCILAIQVNGITTGFRIKTGFVPYENTGERRADGELVFAGYGITAKELNYDDYQDIDARGKVVLIFRHEPGEDDSSATLFKGKLATKYSNLFDKVQNAREHGAIGVMVVTEPLNYKSIRPRGFPWPSLSKTLPRDALPTGYCMNDADSIPVVQVGEEVISCIFSSIDSLKSLQQMIDSTFKPHSFTISGTQVNLETPVKKSEKYVVNNVVGFLPGSDPLLKNEVVVVGAHYDHVGISREKNNDRDSIFNGADDNASGTSGVMAVAKAMTAMKKKPLRSVLFITFAGEEKGLYGSGYYVKHPLYPLENTIAMLNMDMIGRNSPDSIEIIGALRCPELAQIIEKENRKTGFVLSEKGMSGGSDHWYFFKEEIPAIHFFSGLHKDYHQVSDNPDTIDAEKAARVARLVFLTAWDIAFDSNKYRILQGEDEETLY